MCDVPYVGKRWVRQTSEYDRERRISYWTKNYRTGIELQDDAALDRRYPYYDPVTASSRSPLPCPTGRCPRPGDWWGNRRAGCG
ncbi:hypothetical protein GCM10010452_70870 [Crossiella cryophila]